MTVLIRKTLQLAVSARRERRGAGVPASVLSDWRMMDGALLLAPSLPLSPSRVRSDSYQKLALTMIGRKNDDEGAAQVACASKCR